ncbi:putative cinnamate beta-D-glucosyltransferase-like [Capsicum annuum]|nr:putative cinnamate beta-D-glucosyltransferase-like [Capsicum annuum]
MKGDGVVRYERNPAEENEYEYEYEYEEEERIVEELGMYKGKVRLVNSEEPTEETMLLWGIQQPTFSKPNAFARQTSLQLRVDACGRSLSILQSPSNLMRHIRAILTIFEGISGLHVNWKESCLYPVNKVDNMEVLASNLRCQVAALPTMYLGMPLGKNKEMETSVETAQQRCFHCEVMLLEEEYWLTTDKELALEEYWLSTDKELALESDLESQNPPESFLFLCECHVLSTLPNKIDQRLNLVANLFVGTPGVTGSVMWDSGVVLGKFLEHSVESGRIHLQGKKVVELGSGCGLVGCVAALLGAQAILTDLPDRLRLLKKNVEANFYGDVRGSATVNELTWGDELDNDMRNPLPDYDSIFGETKLHYCCFWIGAEDEKIRISNHQSFLMRVLGSDVIYSEGAVMDLLATLLDLSGTQTTVILAGELRNDAILEYFLQAAAEDFTIGRVDQKQWHPDCCSPRVVIYVLVKKQRNL